ncbi:MAG TPA: hypothetical protein EYG18_05030 [Micavibrio sp.]|nr:hypothetical protein [Micavibrio sp.]HIL28613.1 hypothetical protein [Micavibrio sp.]
MIQVIGLKRLIILSVLLAFNAALGAGLYLYVMPENLSVTRQLSSTRSQVATMRNDAQELRGDIEQIEDKKSYFTNLQTVGFMSDQNRLVARRRIMDIQQYSKVLKAKYDIGSAVVMDDENLSNSDQVVLSSELAINIDAMDDIDFYSFIYWLRNTFPGHVTIDNIKMQRMNDVNDVTVRQIGSGLPMTMIKGDVSAKWRTIVPKSTVTDGQTPLGQGF